LTFSPRSFSFTALGHAGFFFYRIREGKLVAREIAFSRDRIIFASQEYLSVEIIITFFLSFEDPQKNLHFYNNNNNNNEINNIINKKIKWNYRVSRIDQSFDSSTRYA